MLGGRRDRTRKGGQEGGNEDKQIIMADGREGRMEGRKDERRRKLKE